MFRVHDHLEGGEDMKTLLLLATLTIAPLTTPPILTREIPISENIQADMTDAILDMASQMKAVGCLGATVSAQADSVKDNTILITMICVDFAPSK